MLARVREHYRQKGLGKMRLHHLLIQRFSYANPEVSGNTTLWYCAPGLFSLVMVASLPVKALPSSFAEINRNILFSKSLEQWIVYLVFNPLGK